MAGLTFKWLKAQVRRQRDRFAPSLKRSPPPPPPTSGRRRRNGSSRQGAQRARLRVHRRLERLLHATRCGGVRADLSHADLSRADATRSGAGCALAHESRVSHQRQQRRPGEAVLPRSSAARVAATPRLADAPQEAESRGLHTLEGHRSGDPRAGAPLWRVVDRRPSSTVGGLRVSLFNAMPSDGVDALLAFMAEFQKAHSA